MPVRGYSHSSTIFRAPFCVGREGRKRREGERRGREEKERGEEREREEEERERREEREEIGRNVVSMSGPYEHTGLSNMAASKGH